MAIVCVLAVLVAPALGAFGKTTAVTTGGSRFAGLVSVARQNAISRQTLTALVLSNMEGTRGRLLTILELQPQNETEPLPADWRQVTQWELLPDGVIMEHLSSSQAAPFPPLPPLAYAGTILDDCKKIVFCPDGTILDPGCQTFRLAEGYYKENSATPTYTRPDEDGGPKNYCDVTILPKSGRAKIDRP